MDKKQNQSNANGIEEYICEGSLPTWNIGLMDLVGNGNSKGDQTCE